MKAVILGAGASFDSIYEYYPGAETRYIPPLTKDLFSPRPEFLNILNKYPGAKHLSHIARTQSNIESFLEDLKQSIDNHENLELTANFTHTIFYLQELFNTISRHHRPSGFNNYQILAHSAQIYSKAKKEPVIFITFNYDTLLEMAIASTLGRTTSWDSIDDYTSYDLKVFKPHGSCSWSSRIENFCMPNNDSTNKDLDKIIYQDPSLFKSFKYDKNKILIHDDPITFRKTQQLYNNEFVYNWPLLAVPLVSKTDFLFPDSHLTMLNDCLQKVDDVLIIGWRASEIKFMDLLKETMSNRKVNFTIVAGADPEASKNIRSTLPKASIDEFESGFLYSPSDKFHNIETGNSFSTIPINNGSFQFEKGSFSSYSMQYSRKIIPSFFSN